MPRANRCKLKRQQSAVEKAGVFRFSWKWRRRSPTKLRERRMKKQRKHYAPEEKVAILRRHLLEHLKAVR